MPASEVVIVGGGVVGASTAYYLAAAGASVTLLEWRQIASGASGASAGGVRQSFRDPAELPLAMYSVDLWTNLAEELEADLHYLQTGHVHIIESEAQRATLEAGVARLQAGGLDIRLIGPDDLRELAPGVTDRAIMASYCPRDGSAQPQLTTFAFARAAERRGARIRTGEAVTRLRSAGGRVDGVETREGSYSGQAVVLAVGAWCNRLLGPLGMRLPVTARAPQMLITERMPPSLKPVLTCVGRRIRLQQLRSGQYLVGGGWPADPDLETGLSWTRPASVAGNAATVADLYPAARRAAMVRAWAGVEPQSIDGLAIIGAAPGLDGLYLATGFSGHGFAIGPGTGKLLAQLITTGRTDLPLDGLGPQRFATLDPAAIDSFIAGGGEQRAGTLG
ncbi:MAG: FAD-binding oxidoreductase [Chloroflexi bacterium]|nr:FAD-binding oxidoreductase [Chloroflexota bacterium]